MKHMYGYDPYNSATAYTVTAHVVNWYRQQARGYPRRGYALPDHNPEYMAKLYAE